MYGRFSVKFFFDRMEDSYVVFELLLKKFRRQLNYASRKLRKCYHENSTEVRSKFTSTTISYLPQESR